MGNPALLYEVQRRKGLPRGHEDLWNRVRNETIVCNLCLSHLTVVGHGPVLTCTNGAGRGCGTPEKACGCSEDWGIWRRHRRNLRLAHVAGIGRAEKRKLCPCPTVLSALPMAKPGGLGLNQRLGSWGRALAVDGYRDRLCLLGKG